MPPQEGLRDSVRHQACLLLRKSRWASFGLLLTALSVRAEEPVQQLSQLRTLNTAHEAHALTQKDAAHGYPVHLRGVVTYWDPYNDERHAALFLKDASGSIFAAIPHSLSLPLRPGIPIEVTGVTAPGDFAPIVAPSKIRVLGPAQPLPQAPRVTLARLLTGAEDAQWVEVEGLVHSVGMSGKEVVLNLTTSDGALTATTPFEPGGDYERLVDAKVVMRAVAGALYNEKQQLIGVRLLLPNLSTVRVEEPAPADPFSLPVLSAGSLLQYSDTVTLQHRVHLRGRLTLHWPGRLLCIQTGNDALCMQTQDTSILQEGELVDVAGFPARENSQPTLSDAILRPAGASVPFQLKEITVDEAFRKKHSSELVRIEGVAIGTSLIMNDPALLVSSGGFVFPAIPPPGLDGAKTRLWLQQLEGSKVAITGVFSSFANEMQSLRNGGIQAESFQILMRSPADVRVMAKPSWWTERRALAILGLVLLLTAFTVAWMLLLRRRVKEQTLLLRRSEERFRHLAEHDALTGLASRSLLHERLNEELETARRKQTPLALLMVDVDRFKQINDSLGHAAGDEILRVTAQRIRSSVRDTDTVARLSGDEFIVLLPGVRGLREAGNIAAQVVASVAAPVKFRGREVPVSISVGISSYPDGGDDATTLLHNGDAAMYQAKSLGRNCYRFFTPEMGRAGADHLEFVVALNDALAKEEFEIHYQPLIDMRSGTIEGVEALLRWRNERWGLVSPSDFVPLAEESGLIGAIGGWVLRESCLQVSQLESRLGRKLSLAVNISPRQMQHGDLVRAVADALRDADRDACDLELEITESLLVGNSGRTRETFQQLRALGIRLAIDDFGTGFANLSYITQFEVDRLKIDRSFIQHCLIDRNCATVTRMIIAMAHRLEVSVVAEGVEAAEQYRFLQEADCDLAQGYYLSQPVLLSRLEEMLLASPVWGLDVYAETSR